VNQTRCLNGTELLSTGRSRRSLAGLVGGLFAGGSAAALLGWNDTDAKGKKHHKKKGKGKGKGKHKHHGGGGGNGGGGGQTVQPQPGFKVSGRQILKPDGTPVLLRGVNKMFLFEEDDPTGGTILPQIALSGSNTVRIVWGSRNDNNQATDPGVLDQLISNSLANGLLPMIESHDITDGDLGKLNNVVDYWVQPAVVNVINSHSQALLVNIANEVGDDQTDSNQFISAYTNAVQRMRNANIHTPLVIDAPDFGKNLEVLTQSAQALLSADPDHNLIFSVHTYWGLHDDPPANEQFIASQFDAAIAQNYPLIIGEFSQFGAFNGNQSICAEGGRVLYDVIVEQARQKGIGWYAWEWGPGNEFGGAGCEVMNMTTNGQFATLQNGWARDVAIDLPGSIKNTSTRIV
jgi:mannan endo-1,4-beta-mannosidase